MLDNIMKERKITSKALSEMTGISQRTIEGYRVGRREPSLSAGLAIADALTVDPHELLKAGDSDS